MAVFYYPNRTNPKSVIDIGPLAARKLSEATQNKERTPSTTPIDDLEAPTEYLIVNTDKLSALHKNRLANFIINTTGQAAKAFDFDAEDSTQYNNVSFCFDKLEAGNNQELHLRIDSD